MKKYELKNRHYFIGALLSIVISNLFAVYLQFFKGDVLDYAVARDGKNVLFYPSGHITLNGKESIGNRQLAYNVCRNLPENVTIVCIKTTGLWGSIWSRYKKKKTPSIPLTLLKSVGLILCGKLFTKRRIVEISIQPMTETLKLWSKEDKISFNKKLETFYNEL